jgi:hypothetical protein
VIVTAKTLAEVKPDLEAAERLGILIISREGLEQGLNRSVEIPNADNIYADGEKAVSAALAKHGLQDAQLEGNLPPSG